MPWHIEDRDGAYCVVGDETGELVADGNHGVDAGSALTHLRTLYAAGPAIVAAATAEVAVAPIAPPREWFDAEEPDGPEPLTIDADGRVHGHLALWDACHIGFMQGALSECVKPPRSPGDYHSFHLGQMLTAEGDTIPVGKVVYGGPHASLTAGLEQARSHYDRTSSVGAFVRARDGRHGIYLTGSARSDISQEGLRDMRANPPSGDWRRLNGALELVAALAVGIPGYQTPQVALTAAGADVEALILPGFTEEPWEIAEREIDRGYIRQKRRIRGALVAAALTTRRRSELTGRDFAIPEDRSYPIHDESHARNALARSNGKPEAARVRRAVCRRYPDMGECQKRSVQASAHAPHFAAEQIVGVVRTFTPDTWKVWAAAMTEAIIQEEGCPKPWSSYPSNRITDSTNPERWAASWDGDICYPTWMETKMVKVMKLLAAGGGATPDDIFDGIEVVVHESEHLAIDPNIRRATESDYQNPAGEYWEEMLTEITARLRTSLIVEALGFRIADPMNEDWALYQRWVPWMNQKVVAPMLKSGLSPCEVADAISVAHTQNAGWEARVTALNNTLSRLGIPVIPLDVAEAQGKEAADWDKR